MERRDVPACPGWIQPDVAGLNDELDSKAACFFQAYT